MEGAYFYFITRKWLRGSYRKSLSETLIVKVINGTKLD